MGKVDCKVQLFQAFGLLAILTVLGILAWDFHNGTLNSPGSGPPRVDANAPTGIMEVLTGHNPPELLAWGETWQATHPSTRPSENKQTPEDLQHLRDMIASSDLSALEIRIHREQIQIMNAIFLSATTNATCI